MEQQPIVLNDCRLQMTGNTEAKYPKELRMVKVCVFVNGKTCERQFITNNFDWSAYSICDFYLARWWILVFFKEIEQTSQLADFFGPSENAVKWQSWTAFPTYLFLRLVGWIAEWKQSFRRLYILIKGMSWSRLNISELLKFAVFQIESNTPLPSREE